MKIPGKGFTHGGKFHADDVFSTALLQLLRPDIQVTRGFTVPDGFDGIVYDVGGGMFDHHTEPREARPNGTPYAAFGLLWRVLGAGLVGEHQARLLDENFIQPLDLNDNTGEQNSLADAIGSFNPVWDCKDDPDVCFWRAVPFAKAVLENEIAQANAVNRADATVQNAHKNAKDGIVVLPAYMPWKNGLYKTDAVYVVYPSQRGGWSAQCVNDTKTKRSKQPFPASWGGQPEEILRQKSGLGLRFCHPSRFLITTDTKEDAVAACRYTLKAAGRPVSE
ncbi:MAG: MYG1 family protein [Gemmiger sp.]|nr:MYG1 family protein [Gemmiger sp.]